MSTLNAVFLLLAIAGCNSGVATMRNQPAETVEDSGSPDDTDGPHRLGLPR